MTISAPRSSTSNGNAQPPEPLRQRWAADSRCCQRAWPVASLLLNRCALLPESYAQRGKLSVA